MESDLQTQTRGHSVLRVVRSGDPFSLAPHPPGRAGALRAMPGLAVPSWAGSDNPDLLFSTSVRSNCPKIDDRCKENNEA